METTFKAGIIGCGGRGRSHARGYQASPDVDIVACSDPVEDARNDFAEQFEVPQYLRRLSGDAGHRDARFCECLYVDRTP